MWYVVFVKNMIYLMKIYQNWPVTQLAGIFGQWLSPKMRAHVEHRNFISVNSIPPYIFLSLIWSVSMGAWKGGSWLRCGDLPPMRMVFYLRTGWQNCEPLDTPGIHLSHVCLPNTCKKLYCGSLVVTCRGTFIFIFGNFCNIISALSNNLLVS